MGLVIVPISSIDRKPSVTQWRFTTSALEALICAAAMLLKRAGERHVAVGERCRCQIVRSSSRAMRNLDP